MGFVSQFLVFPWFGFGFISFKPKNHKLRNLVTIYKGLGWDYVNLLNGMRILYISIWKTWFKPPPMWDTSNIRMKMEKEGICII